MNPKLLLAGLLLVLGCVDAARHSRSLHPANEREMTVGVVQREIRHGMSQAEVAEALGSPNIVTRDRDGRETWVYDKIATEASYSSSRGGVGGAGGAAGVAGTTLLLGILTGSYDAAAGASATTQRTLTVLVKFGESRTVESFSYHSSKF